VEVLDQKTLPQGTMVMTVGAGSQVAFGEVFVYTINLSGYLVKMTVEEWDEVFQGAVELPDGLPGS